MRSVSKLAHTLGGLKPILSSFWTLSTSQTRQLRLLTACLNLRFNNLHRIFRVTVWLFFCGTKVPFTLYSYENKVSLDSRRGGG
jgi:hypothetical protein